MYLCVYSCSCIYQHICLSLYLRLYGICIHTYKLYVISKYACIYLCMYIGTCVCMSTYIRAFVCMYVCSRVLLTNKIFNPRYLCSFCINNVFPRDSRTNWPFVSVPAGTITSAAGSSRQQQAEGIAGCVCIRCVQVILFNRLHFFSCGGRSRKLNKYHVVFVLA